MKYVIANWKAHKNEEDVLRFLSAFQEKISTDTHVQNIINNIAKVIICPPAPFILTVKKFLVNYPSIFIGAQDISRYDEGAYTGETIAKMLTGQVRFSIIGHSERRTIFNETEEAISQKITLSKQYDIEPILCIRGEQDSIHEEATFIAYEPQESIGTGKYKSVEDILRTKRALPLSENHIFIYGGSVNEHVCKSYFENPEIHGLLIGNSSLDPLHFFQILSQVV